ncbi:MAG TPA: MFS transporter [bacterium]|nr:MFS transporter [bacterium]
MIRIPNAVAMTVRGQNMIFYGWYVAGMAFVVNFMATGTGFYVFNAFMEPLVKERGWTYTQINRSLMIGPAVAIVSQLVFGTLVTKIGPRILMALGPLLAGVCFIFMGRVTDIRWFYLLYSLLCLGNGAMAGIVSATAVNNWFIMKRGRALGFATAGISVSGVVLPVLALAIMGRTGMASAYLWIGVSILAVSPLCWFLVRDWPEQHGLRPDGAEDDALVAAMAGPAGASGPAGMTGSGAAPLWDLSRLLRVQAFWKIGLAYALVLASVSGVMSQLKPRFAHTGFDDVTAMYMMAATALTGTMGKFFWGMLCDRFDPRRVAGTLMAVGGVSLALILLQGSLPALILFIVIYGFSMGGVNSTFPIMVAHFFGRESFARVAKYLALLIVLQGLGPWAMGRSFDLTHSYNGAYYFFIAVNLAAAALIISTRRPRLREDTRAPWE